MGRTIITVEVPEESAVIRTKPDDFEWGEGEVIHRLVGMRGPAFFYAGYADGSVGVIDASTDRHDFLAMITRSVFIADPEGATDAKRESGAR